MSIPKSAYYALMLLSLFLLIVRWKKLDSQVHIFSGLLLLAFITEKVHDTFYPQPVSKYVYHIYQTLEMLLLSYYYYFLFQIKRNRHFVLTGVLIYLTYYSYYFIYSYQNLVTHKKNDMEVESFFIITFSVLYLIELYQKDQPVILKKHPHFWIVIANLMFYSITLFFYAFQHYLLTNHFAAENYRQLYIIPKISNLVLYLLYSIAFVCNINMPMRKLF